MFGLNQASPKYDRYSFPLNRLWIYSYSIQALFGQSLSLPHSDSCVAVESGASAGSFPTSGHTFYESDFLSIKEYDLKGKNFEAGE